MLFLCIVGVYTLYSCSRIVFRLRSLKNKHTGEESRSTQRSLFVLQQRATDLRQLHLFTFFLFALCFLLQVPTAFSILVHSNRPLLSIIFDNLAIYIAYAADVFFVLLVLHSAQWFVSIRISSVTLRFNAPRIDNQE